MPGNSPTLQGHSDSHAQSAKLRGNSYFTERESKIIKSLADFVKKKENRETQKLEKDIGHHIQGELINNHMFEKLYEICAFFGM